MTLNESERFKLSVDFVLQHEGGYVNDPKDPGGETKFGIAKKYHPSVDIKNLTEQQARDIYYKEYWVPSGAILAEWPLCAVMMDTAVNTGITRLKRFMKKSISADGGISTRKLLEAREQYYIDLAHVKPRFKRFLKGWINRVNSLRKYISLNGV